MSDSTDWRDAGREDTGREGADWDVVKVVGTDEEAALIAGFLESRGVVARVESLLFHQEPVTFGRLAEVRVRVPGEHAEEARRLLAELEDGPPEQPPADPEPIE